MARNPIGRPMQDPIMAPFYKQNARKLRSPSHTFHLRSRPYCVQPFMLAPVLPGETLKSALLQVRAVSDPIKNPLIGWWLEHHLFYVKLRDLAGRADFEAMMLDPDLSLAAYEAAADAEWYHGAGGVQWVKLCTQTIVDNFFRDQPEVFGDYTIGNMYAAQIKQETWANSAMLDDDFVVDQPANVDLDASGTITAEEVQRALRMWSLQQQHNLTDMTFEDFLRTHGVNVPSEEKLYMPELLRSWVEWTYPTNTIDPADGSPSSAVSWAVTGRADKDRFFKEWGFIVGVQVSRPKVYLRAVDGAAGEYLKTALNWLPAIMADDPLTSLRKETNASGPLQTLVTDAGGYWWDVKDLFVYGDQFLNFALSATDANIVDLPAGATLNNKRYPDSDDVDALFVGASPANKIRSDGVCDLNIMGRTWDTTPGVPAIA